MPVSTTHTSLEAPVPKLLPVITLLGGSGFVGTELTQRLASEASQVRVLTRRAQRVKAFRIFANVDVIEVDIHDAAKLSAAIDGSDVVINLVGILNSSGGKPQNSFDGAHADLTATVVKACKTAGVPRYLHMSSLGADAQSGSSDYLKSKGAAENHVRAAKHLASTIFRPSVIFGPGDSFFNRFATLLQLAPVMPLACADAKLQPVYIGDVCEAMINALHNPDTVGQTFELGGPDVFTLKEIVTMTAELKGLFRPIIALPDAIGKIQALCLEFVPGKPFSRDNFASLQTDNVLPEGVAPQPTSVSAVVPRYLGNTDLNGELQSYRSMARR